VRLNGRPDRVQGSIARFIAVVISSVVSCSVADFYRFNRRTVTAAVNTNHKIATEERQQNHTELSYLKT